MYHKRTVLYGGITLNNADEVKNIQILQYDNLRNCFNALLESAFGEDYYNMGMDVYSCDYLSCEDLAKKLGKEYYRRYKLLAKQKLYDKL